MTIYTHRLTGQTLTPVKLTSRISSFDENETLTGVEFKDLETGEIKFMTDYQIYRLLVKK